MTRVKGWCPTAHAPLQSGDGLLVRIRPPSARLSADQALSLCALADAFGNGMIDITSRANLQLRGVQQADHEALLKRLVAAELADADPLVEAQRRLTVTPFWQPGDLTDRLATRLDAAAPADLPAKFGIVVDSGPAPVLSQIAGDIRFERAGDGTLLLRADGAVKGQPIEDAQAETALCELADWFLATGGAAAGRMARHLQETPLPAAWQQISPAPANPAPSPGPTDLGTLYGVPFGQTDASALAALIRGSGAAHLRVTPWRMLLLEANRAVSHPAFFIASDPLQRVSACPGAPACAEASVPTRSLARDLAQRLYGTLHVSGCAKGCALPRRADVTLVGRTGHFDLVQGGRAGDTPVQTGLTADDARLLEG